MISCASISQLLLCGAALLLVACGILLYRLGKQSGRSEVQSAFDDYVRDVAELAAGDRQDKALFRLKRGV